VTQNETAGGTSTTAQRYGDVAPTLSAVLRYANYRWSTDITLVELAEALSCDRRTIEHFASGTVKRYDLHTLAKIRWYFDCHLTDLLRRIPPAGGHAAPGGGVDPSLGRTEPPDEKPPDGLVIATRIPEWLANHSVQELEAGLPLHRKAVKMLRDRRLTTRIARFTLAALCTFLSEQTGREIGVEDVLVVETGNTSN
jgi:DNA-binding Xre family transcriptional regulator